MICNKKSIFHFILILVVVLIFSNKMIYSKGNTHNISLNDTLVYLNIPERSEQAIGATEFASQIKNFNLDDREQAIVDQILAGNVPSFSRKLKPLKIKSTISGTEYELTYFTVCDYIAIGSEEDYLYIPMTTSLAQFLANKLGCSLPTKKMVDKIYASAEIKLNPQPISPSNDMVTVPVFMDHTDSIKAQIAEIGLDRSLNNIIGGHKKDIIISNKIYSSDRNYDRVVIYGWHLSVNNPIQPVYNGHIADYADYSHGVRFIANKVFVNGDSSIIREVLKDTNLALLISDERTIPKAYYPITDNFTALKNRKDHPKMGYELYQNYPNPFNPTTTISYQLPENSNVEVSVYNSLNQKVELLLNETQPAGSHKVQWNGSGKASGVYFYSLKAGPLMLFKKMVLLR